MIDARPDFSALAPSPASIPPSFIAVIKNARSSTLPPSCLTTGAAIGIAVVRSSILVTDWFSTALRKSIFLARSSVAIPKAFVTDIVVSSACACSTLPRTASLVAFVTWLIRSAPIAPVAAASAARPRVLSTDIPHLVNSKESSFKESVIFLVSSTVVEKSP